MTERLAEISARIEGVRQLGAVVNAMRGIAAARAQQARRQLLAVDSYAATIAAAIGRVVALAPPPASIARASGRPALVLFCAEQGFAGAFSERVFDAAGADLSASDLFLIGSRGATLGVYAAEGPGGRLNAERHTEGWRLSGPKPWCSLAGELSHALITAWVDEHRRGLFLIDLLGVPPWRTGSSDLPFPNSAFFLLISPFVPPQPARSIHSWPVLSADNRADPAAFSVNSRPPRL